MGDRHQRVIKELVASHGRTYAEEAGIRLKNTPQPLYRTLVLACLLSARIRASIAVAAARALYEAGLRDPRRMAEATWQQRVDALGRGGYRRYDERTSTQLGKGAELVRERWGGDLRRMRDEADGDISRLRTLLHEVPNPDQLVKRSGGTEPAVLAAALVRAALDKQVVEDCLRHVQ
jgi:hypothetical protein